MGTYLGAAELHLFYRIAQCYLSPDIGVCALLNPSRAGQYLICLPRVDRRLS